MSGRFFTKESGSNATAVVINEAGAKALGYSDPVGRTLTSAWHRGELLEVIGVVKDFNFESLHKQIGPLALELIPVNAGGYITVRISNTRDIQQTIQYIQDTWVKHSNNKLFEAFFFDEEYENLYKSEFATSQIFVVFAGLSIFIACLGLIGLFAFMLSAREKEIGIRKLLGAGGYRLVNLLSAELIKMMTIATVISWPLAWFSTEYWLRNFTYRLSVHPALYISSTIVVALICTIAISFQIVKAVNSNPVNALRRE